MPMLIAGIATAGRHPPPRSPEGRTDMTHPERLAAGMSMVNSDGKMHSREYTPFTPWPLWKLALHALGLALLMGAIGGGLWL
jgi:hypothetical protein